MDNADTELLTREWSPIKGLQQFQEKNIASVTGDKNNNVICNNINDNDNEEWLVESFSR